ncbi:hypothetical protein QFC22_005683 [Naganishia vaughanmartiniae]|uniref:Uncharacterized protein n=1 Tax=Naganishia vaughanmartiniae TaxID=1424756 RepID=A0ACC2WS42_9TREE|nr:hypothetical protein QFC22_005683 [Naganishia vaughanmartiniae]
MGVLSWFNPLAYGKKPTPTDYETVLSRLSTDITEAKQHLSEIRLRQRRVSLLINLYGVFLWLVWCGLWYFQRLPWGLVGLYADDITAQAVGLALVVLGPIGLLGLNRLNGMFFSSRRTKEETHLRDLLKSQHDKIEEIKKATNYYSTRDLLEKYDELNGKDTANEIGNLVGSLVSRSRLKLFSAWITRNSVSIFSARKYWKASLTSSFLLAPSPNAVGPGGLPVGPQAQAQMQLLQQQSFYQSMQPVLPTPTKKWYDHVADKLMGEDPSQANQTKFALVCGGCFRHNGLVSGKEEWENMKWICPRCGYFNPSPNSRRESVGQPATPSTPTTTMSPTTTHDAGLDSAEKLRQRKGKTAAGSSGLKNEVEREDVEGSVEGDDRMDVDEPSVRESAKH